MRKKKIIHTRACPHECAACLIPTPKWNLDVWLDGGCPVCEIANRGDTSYACDNCYAGLTPKEVKELTKEIQDVS